MKKMIYLDNAATTPTAQDKVKQSADYVTLSHDEDGVANVIDKFMTPASKEKDDNV